LRLAAAAADLLVGIVASKAAIRPSVEVREAVFFQRQVFRNQQRRLENEILLVNRLFFYKVRR